MLFTTLHSLRYAGRPSHDTEQLIGVLQHEVVPEQLHAAAKISRMMAMDGAGLKEWLQSPLFEVDPPAVDELWMLCDVGQG